MASTLESRRRFIPYVVWSSRIGGTWDEIANLDNIIRRTKNELDKNQKLELIADIERLRGRINDTCGSIGRANWFNVDLDSHAASVGKRDIREFVFEDYSFDTYCINSNKLLDELRSELEELGEIPFDFIGTDSSDGLDLYFDEEKNEYVKVIDVPSRDEADWIAKDGKLLKEYSRNEYLTITITYSLETDQGHEEFGAEITVSTRVKGMDSEDVKKAEKTLFDLANENRIPGLEQVDSDVTLKVGAEYYLGGRASTYTSVDILTERTSPLKRRRSYGERTANLSRWIK